MQPIIQIRNLSVIYNEGKPAEFVALNNVDLEILPHEFVIFFGPSGSGKSTLLYVIAGLEMATTGTVSVGSKPNISALSERELIAHHRSSIGMIFQAFYLVPSLSAKDNIELPLLFAGVAPEIRQKKVAPLIDRFGVSDFQDRTPTHLSGGQQQRVAIARSLVNNPEILLADEPVGNLDSKNAEAVLELIHDLHTRDKKTVILVTHDPRHLRYADRIFYIKDGKITRQVRQKPSQPQLSKLRDASVIKEHKASLLDQLALRYPNHDEIQLRAKLILNYLLMPYDLQTLDAIEQYVSQYLKGKLTIARLQQILDREHASGGLNLYKQSAKKIVEQVQEIAIQAELVEATRIESSVIVKILITNHKLTVTALQQTRLTKVIDELIAGKMTQEESLHVLDLPIGQGGVGLHSRTAKKMAQHLSLLLLGDEHDDS